jgi:lysozyme family protein
MKDDFPFCNNVIMQFDGFKNDSAPGETFKTSYAITEYTYQTAFAQGVVTVPFADLTRADADNILRVLFWQAAGCDRMPSGPNMMVYHCATGCGVGHAVRLAQRIVGVAQDACWGPDSEAALTRMGVKPFIDAMFVADDEYFASLAKAALYLRGWEHGEETAHAGAYKLAGIGEVETTPVPVAPAPVDEADALDARFNPGIG